MKNSILLTLILIFFFSTVDAAERETLMGSHNYDNGGFGGPTLTFTQLNSKSTWGLGGKGAWLLNHSYYLGGGGYNSFLNEPDNDGLVQHEGLILGYIVQPNKIFHFTLEVLLGGGQLILDKQDNTDFFFAAEPQAYLSINLATVAIMNIGASYRFISGSDDNEFTDSALSGTALHVNFMFGEF